MLAETSFVGYMAHLANSGFCFWAVKGEIRVSTRYIDELWERVQEPKIAIAVQKRSAETANPPRYNGQSLAELLDHLDAALSC